MNRHDHARLLLSIVRERWDEARALMRRATVDPAAFVELCREADVSAWVHARLAAGACPELAGAEVMDPLGRVRARVRNDNLLLIARAEQALDALHDAGVRPVALKGLDLLHRVYERIDLRTLDDVDLLIRRDELEAALAALEREGWTPPDEPRRTHYLRSSHHLPLCSPGPVTVDFEIHWNLAQETRYAIDPRALHDRAVALDVGGRRLLRLEDHDLVAHLLLHHFTHYFDRRLKWAVDLAAVSRLAGFDWRIVVERVRSWGATAAAGMSLAHLHKLVPEWIPEAVLEGLPVAAWRRALTWPLRSHHPLELFRGTRRRGVQLYVAAVLLENPLLLPRWLAHRATRDRRAGDNPLDARGGDRRGSDGNA